MSEIKGNVKERLAYAVEGIEGLTRAIELRDADIPISTPDALMLLGVKSALGNVLAEIENAEKFLDIAPQF